MIVIGHFYPLTMWVSMRICLAVVSSLVLAAAADTAALGERVGARLFEGAVICLTGDLGAGKTCFAQGVARGLGVRGPVQSPTFILIAEYPEARVPLRHADLYRLETLAEARGLGLEERVGVDGAWVIEWADRWPELWPEDRLDLVFTHLDHGRRVDVRAAGPRHVRLLELFRG